MAGRLGKHVAKFVELSRNVIFVFQRVTQRLLLPRLRN
jgi:hypothetical protein